MYQAVSSESIHGTSSPEVFKNLSAGELLQNPLENYVVGLSFSPDMTPEAVKQANQKPKNRRTTIPDKPNNPMGLWGLIKSAIGKDLTKVPLPVNFSEPLSMLQRLVEDYEYSSILDKASNMKNSLEQMAAVAAFTVSSYSSTTHRTAKPFNPLLGETFECDR